MPSFEQRLDRLAEVAVKVGVRVRPGQELVMTAPVEALPLARKITEHAYKAGASLVTTLFSDDAMTLLRFQHATDDSFDKATGWLFDGMEWSRAFWPDRECREVAGSMRRHSTSEVDCVISMLADSVIAIAPALNTSSLVCEALRGSCVLRRRQPSQSW